MGEVVCSDFALSIRVLHKVLGHLDQEWDGARTMERRKPVVEIVCFFTLSFCLGLRGEEVVKRGEEVVKRGEEVVKIDIAGFLMYFAARKDYTKDQHVMVPLLGRFKGETGERLHLLPIVWKTRSGIKVGLWATRLKTLLLERTPNMNIEDDYAIPRPGQRGSTTEAVNQGGPSEIIKMICQWWKVERAQRRVPNLGMWEHYMVVSQVLKTFLKYSRPL
jgi:hypothetical protein